MNAMMQTQLGLLTDVANISKFSEIRGLEVEQAWYLKEAPLLEKHVLEVLENQQKLELDRFPTQLRRLVARSIVEPSYLRLLRQLLLFCYKAAIPHEKATQEAALAAFKLVSGSDSTEKTLKSIPEGKLAAVRQHVTSVLYGLNERDFLPSHGPGSATSSKDVWEVWYEDIDRLWPYGRYYLCGLEWSNPRRVDPPISATITCKATAVPKDSRGPRIVCVHPAEAIWHQQGARRMLERAILKQRDDRYGWAWPRGQVHFDDQSVNQLFALGSSINRDFSTIDLQEASDRLSDVLVRHCFASHYPKFGCSRAQFVECPQLKEKWGLTCYAPMGNATTFPVQSLMFWAICVMSLEAVGCKPDCLVFGDDIIVPTDYAHQVCEDLETFGLKVNRRKTFIHGYFRESCGMDAYKGVCVTPTRWKIGEDIRTLMDAEAACDLSKRLLLGGYPTAAWQLQQLVRVYMRVEHGITLAYSADENASGLVLYSPRLSLVMEGAKWHRRYQQFAVPCWSIEPKRINARCSGWNHVLESVISLERTGQGRAKPEVDSRRPQLKREWLAAL